MKVVKLKGGLGNQMFQYAFAKYLEIENDEKVFLDFSTYKFRNDSVRKPRITEFNISLEAADENVIKSVCFFKHKGDMLKSSYKVLIGLETIFNKKYLFQRGIKPIDLKSLKKYNYYDGYWQSWKIVEFVKDVLKEDFNAKRHISDIAEKKILEVNRENSVFVGIRRGDYIDNKRNLKIYGTFDEVYYMEAMKIISQKVPNARFYIFSNDMEWVKKNMEFKHFNVTYNNVSGSVSDFEELLIMSKCKHAIICNSTYYWWGAWLIENPNKVIVAPKNWFANGKNIDIIPDEWIKL